MYLPKQYRCVTNFAVGWSEFSWELNCDVPGLTYHEYSDVEREAELPRQANTPFSPPGLLVWLVNY